MDLLKYANGDEYPSLNGDHEFQLHAPDPRGFHRLPLRLTALPSPGELR